jgi:NADH:ubiquinone oxidoreductase subunit F (NADH-binding)
VQNVESLAQAALIARWGDDWYRSAGRGSTRGTALVTVSGFNTRLHVREIEYGTGVGEVAERFGLARPGGAVLLGGYFGGWARFDEIRDDPLDPAILRERGLGFGCGMVAIAGQGTCGVLVTAEILAFMADASAAQCGPCLFGLAAMAGAARRLADGTPRPGDLAHLERWADAIEGRGACHHPDGAVGLLRSALRVFPDEFARHAMARDCSAAVAA